LPGLRRSDLLQQFCSAANPETAVQFVGLGSVTVVAEGLDLVRLIEQDVQLPIVVLVAEVDDAFLLLIAQVVRSAVEDCLLPSAEQRRTLTLRLGVLLQLRQADVQVSLREESNS
jgi:hypothetical protein